MLEIIGQEKLKATFKQIELPQLTILLGPKGSGRTTFSKYLAHDKNYTYIAIDNKIANIRQMIEDTVALSSPTIYFIKDADNMTLQAANAMLKISEEPPMNLYIIMGLTSTENTLPTIISRGKVFRMDNYNRLDLEQYYNTTYTEEFPLVDKLISCCNNIGDMITYLEHDFEKCYSYAKKVYDNILDVSTGNSFKIGNNVGFKPEQDDLIPVDLFFNIFLEVLRNEITKDNIHIIREMIRYTMETRQEMNRKGANRRLAFDLWILNIRKLRG